MECGYRELICHLRTLNVWNITCVLRTYRTYPIEAIRGKKRYLASKAADHRPPSERGTYYVAGLK